MRTKVPGDDRDAAAGAVVPTPGRPRLFAPEEMQLRRSGEARFLDLARLPALRPPGERQRRADEDRRTMARLREQGHALAGHFGLAFAALEAEAEGVVEHYGICYRDGLIRIRLRHATTGKLLKESSLVDTLCHELAHLRHFDHSTRFRRFYETILDEARERGFYRPGPEVRGPVQGSLFDGTGCGTGPRTAAGAAAAAREARAARAAVAKATYAKGRTPRERG